jgi:hypothetical protein
MRFLQGGKLLYDKRGGRILKGQYGLLTPEEYNALYGARPAPKKYTSKVDPSIKFDTQAEADSYDKYNYGPR